MTVEDVYHDASIRIRRDNSNRPGNWLTLLVRVNTGTATTHATVREMWQTNWPQWARYHGWHSADNVTAPSLTENTRPNRSARAIIRFYAILPPPPPPGSARQNRFDRTHAVLRSLKGHGRRLCAVRRVTRCTYTYRGRRYTCHQPPPPLVQLNITRPFAPVPLIFKIRKHINIP